MSLAGPSSGNTPQAPASLPADLLPLASYLLSASQAGDLPLISSLLAQGAPAWYQDDALGWSCLHYGAAHRRVEVLEALLRGGAVWNAVDKWGRTAGEVCVSLGWKRGWEVVRNAGVRSEMLRWALEEDADENEEDEEHRADGVEMGENGAVTLKAEEKGSAGDNMTFLKGKLRWEMGDDGKERVMDEDGNGVMMGWEEPLMRAHVEWFTAPHATQPADGPSQPLKSVINIGYGLGIIDRMFHDLEGVEVHTIIEAHPDVLRHMRETGVYDWPNVRVLEGRWQDWLLDDEKAGEVMRDLPGMGYDAVFIDTFAEGYKDLKQFFESLLMLLEPETGKFSFWNGLGATNATIYDVSCELVDMHVQDLGLQAEYQIVPIHESLREQVWKGVRRRYWDLPSYKLPQITWSIPA